MNLLASTQDHLRDIVTYELSDGRRVEIYGGDVRRFGAAAMLRRAGLGQFLSTGRVPVMQSGRRVGTMSPDFDPAYVCSRSPLYDPRPGDFRRDGDVWIADKMLGPGDLMAVAGFLPETPSVL